jgi:hypothetical protein
MSRRVDSRKVAPKVAAVATTSAGDGMGQICSGAARRSSPSRYRQPHPDRPTCFWRKSPDSPQFSRCLAMTGFFHHAGHGDHRGRRRKYIRRCSVDTVSSVVNFNHTWPFAST